MDIQDFALRKCILFDFDGTLANTVPAILATGRKALREYGMTDEQMGDLSRLIGPPFPQGYCDIYGMSLEDAWKVTTRYREIFATLGPETHPLYDGMREVLEGLKQAGKRLAIASSRQQRLVEEMLVDQGVYDYFETVSAQVDPNKSHKAYLIEQVLTRMGVQAQDALMVGDRRYDVEGATQVGIPCIGVVFNTAPREELEQAGAAAIVQTPRELGNLLLGKTK